MARGRDREVGRKLALGWDEHDSSAPSGAPPQDLAPSSAESSASPSADGSAPGPTRRKRLLAIGALAALVLALLVGLQKMGVGADGPEDVARDFLQSMVDGDVEAVLPHTSPARNTSRAALTAEVMHGVPDPVQDFEILDVTRESGAATVTALLRSTTGENEVTLSLRASAAGAFSPVSWEILPLELPRVSIPIPVAAQRIEINDVEFDLVEVGVSTARFGSPQIILELMPGTYRFVFPSDSQLMDSATASVTVPPSFGRWRKQVEAEFPPLSIAGTQEVERLIDAALQDCLSPASHADGQCSDGVTGELSMWSPGIPLVVTVQPIGQYLWSFTGTPVDGLSSGSGTDEPFAVWGVAYLVGPEELEVTLGRDDGFIMIHCIDEGTGLVYAAYASPEAMQSATVCD